MTSLMLGWILLAEIVSVATDINVEGTVDKTVTIACSHINAGDNVKYFCKGSCSGTDILIKSDQSPRERFTLQDLGKGHFTVNITNLRISDSGIYWCGVDRFGPDTYKKVILTVKNAFSSAHPRIFTPTTTSMRKSISSLPRSSTQTVSTTISNSTHLTTTASHLPPTSTSHQDGPASGILLYIAAGLVGLIIVLLISLIVCCRYQKKKDSEQKFNSVYEDVKIYQIEERKPSRAALGCVSPAECTYGNVLPLQNIEHVDNPLYNTREQFMTVYSTVK